MFNIGDKVIRKSDTAWILNNPVLYNCPNGLPQPKTIYVVNKIASDLSWGNKIGLCFINCTCFDAPNMLGVVGVEVGWDSTSFVKLEEIQAKNRAKRDNYA